MIEYDVFDAVEEMVGDPQLLHYQLYNSLHELNWLMNHGHASPEAVKAATAATIMAWRFANPTERFFGE